MQLSCFYKNELQVIQFSEIKPLRTLMNAIKLLQDHNIAVSGMRIEILQTLARSNIPLSFESFCLNANKTTFYRNMELFEKEGLVITTEIERKRFYELATKAKAYFVCEVCKEISNVTMPCITSGKVKSVLIKGICQKCEKE